jgi:hypothetical protein
VSDTLRSARVEIDSCALSFETRCPSALERLDHMLEATFTDAYYRYSVDRAAPAERLPTLRYVDSAQWGVDYEPAAAACTFSAPWTEIAETTVLAMWLFYLSELVRQERGEYLLHASAVAKGERAIVLFGPSESGKTITSLELCLAHGFQLFANNRIRVGLRNGSPRLLQGDPTFNVRGSSLRAYSESLARRIFDGEGVTKRKRRVAPATLGIDVAAPNPQIAVFALLALDARGSLAPAERIASDITSRDAFRAVASLYQEISSRVRGAAFIPIALRPGSEEFFVPSLDTPDFVRRRMRFLEALFASSTILKIRAPLDHTVAELLRCF